MADRVVYDRGIRVEETNDAAVRGHVTYAIYQNGQRSTIEERDGKISAWNGSEFDGLDAKLKAVAQRLDEQAHRVLGHSLNKTKH